MSLKASKQEKAQIKSKLSRFQTFLYKFDPVNGIAELSKRLQAIEPLLKQFEDVTLQIDSLSVSESGQDEHSDSETVAFEDTYFSLSARAQAVIDAAKEQPPVKDPTGSTKSVEPQSIYKKLNLPQISLPKFTGDYSEYMNFHSAFTALVDKNDTLSNFEKFTFLNSCLEGEAAKVIQSLEISGENYDDAWTLIKNRYENKQVIINSHLKKLFGLPQLTRENSGEIRNLTDCLRREIKALKNLNQAVDSWDSILVYMMTDKLDYTSKRQWQSSVQRDSLPTIQEFLNFLDSRCIMLETVYTKSATSNQNMTKKCENRKFEKKSYANLANSGEIACRFCKGAHLLYYCKKFLSLVPVKRLVEVKQLNLCVKCLRTNHVNHGCVESKCKVCNKSHNTLLHIDGYKEAAKTSNIVLQDGAVAQGIADSGNAERISSLSAHYSESSDTIVLLSTALIYIHDRDNQLVECRCLLDTGSQSNFMTSELAKRLKLHLSRVSLPIIGINNKASQVCHRVKSIVQAIDDGFSSELSFLILDEITGSIPANSFSISNLNIPADIQLADPNFNQRRKIDILLGVSSFYELLDAEQIRLGKKKPILQKSKLGWIVSGSLHTTKKGREMQLSAVCQSIGFDELRDQIEKFWVVEDISATRGRTRVEEYCERHFVENHYRDSDGRFVVSLPLKENVAELGDNFEIAFKRVLGIEKRLTRNLKLSEMYIDFMREYERLGHMSELKGEQIVHNNDVVFYLPHHAVFKKSSAATKLRVVFDGSCKSSTNLSLNDVFYVDPVIQDDLFSILLRFRKHKFVLKADITKMYRQINVNPNQRNLQRILWREASDQEIKHFTLNTVTYGTAPASFLAARSLHQIAFEYKNKFPSASKIIVEDFYMDDLITGGETVSEVRQLKLQVAEVLESAGLILSQWMSNDVNILEPCERNKIKNFLMSEDGTLKTLGVLWNTGSDTFQYAGNMVPGQMLTKRSVLSIISQVFDPLGLIGPIIIRAKIILQKLWQQQIDWDEPIPSDLGIQFNRVFNDLQAIKQISIPRCVIGAVDTGIQIHGFSDASEVAYGACVYVRSRDKVGNNQNVHLLCAKSRVAPLKTLSLPRLELCGAVLLTQLVKKVLTALKINIDKVFLWTDSEIVLAWIAQDSSKWKTFVSNRVSEIQRSIPNATWGHVSSVDNPADVISRGCDASQLRGNRLWLSGPAWLGQEPKVWSKQANVDRKELTELKEIKGQVSLNAIDANNVIMYERFSKFNRLLRAVAYCHRFIDNCKTAEQNLTLSELKRAEGSLVRLIQNQHFAKELRDLASSKCISKASKLAGLNLFVDEFGTLRVGGRLRNSSLCYEQKFPIILSANHRFVQSSRSMSALSTVESKAFFPLLEPNIGRCV